MDYSRLDLVRRSATPVELDLVESFAQRPDHASPVHQARDGHRTLDVRRQHGDRGVQHGPAERLGRRPRRSRAARAQARRRSASAATGGSIKVAIQRPVQIDPIAMQDLGGYGVVAQCFEFLCHARQERL